MPKKGYKQSPEQAEKSRLALQKARLNITSDSYRKISESLKGDKNPMYGKPLPKSHRDNISNSLKGKKKPKGFGQNQSKRQMGENNPMFGKTTSNKQKEIVAKMMSEKRGEKSYAWKGGITPVRTRVRESIKYKEWRDGVYITDAYTCVCCEKTGGEINAHHIKPFSDLLREAIKLSPLLDPFEAAMLYEPLWDLKNGITLCETCHEKIHGKFNYIETKLHVA